MFEDIENVRNASRQILGDSFKQSHEGGIFYAMNSHEAFDTSKTFVCNAVSNAPDLSCGAVNVGILREVKNDVDDYCINCEIGMEERELGIDDEANDVFFTIEAEEDLEAAEEIELL